MVFDDHWDETDTPGTLTRFTTRTTPAVSEYWLAAALITGVFAITPLLGGIFEHLALPLPLLLAFGAVLGCYGLGCLVIGALRRGGAVSLLVLMTVGANIPLAGGDSLVGSIDPQLWAFQIPLIGVLGIYAWQRWTRDGEPLSVSVSPLVSWVRSLSRAHLLLLGFAAWTVLSLPFIAGPRPGMAAWFTIYVVQLAAVFIFVTRLIEDGVLTRHSTVGIVLLAVGGHSLLAVAQVVNHGPLGLTYLGEGVHQVAAISLGPLGTVPTGPYVSGVAGGAAFASLCVLAAPILAAVAYRAHGLQRVAAGLSAVLVVTLVQFTAWDASRGGLLVGFGLLGCAWVTARFRLLERYAPDVLAVQASGLLGVLLVPFVVGIHSLRRPPGARSPPPRFDDPPDRSDHFALEHLDPQPALDFVTTLSLPGFNVANFIPRVFMYVIGLDLFLQYPIFGIGGANFAFLAEDYGFLTSHEMHNLAIMLLAETGLPGFLLYTGALVAVAIGGWRVFRETSDPLYLGILAGMAGYLAAMMLRSGFIRAPAVLTFWALAAVLVARPNRDGGLISTRS